MTCIAFACTFTSLNLVARLIVFPELTRSVSLYQSSCSSGRRDKNRTSKEVYDYLSFLDSYRFMGCSLDKLAKYSPEEKFQNLNNCFPSETKAKNFIEKVTTKFFVEFHNFEETFERIMIRFSWRLVNHRASTGVCRKVYRNFNCSNLENYNDLYLLTDF